MCPPTNDSKSTFFCASSVCRPIQSCCTSQSREGGGGAPADVNSAVHPRRTAACRPKVRIRSGTQVPSSHTSCAHGRSAASRAQPHLVRVTGGEVEHGVLPAQTYEAPSMDHSHALVNGVCTRPPAARQRAGRGAAHGSQPPSLPWYPTGTRRTARTRRGTPPARRRTRPITRAQTCTTHPRQSNTPPHFTAGLRSRGAVRCGHGHTRVAK